MELRGIVKLAHHVEQMIGTKALDMAQRLEPAVNLVCCLEGVIERQIRNHPLDLLGIPQRVLRT